MGLRLKAHILFAVVIAALVPMLIPAAGISVDAGLTPAEDRWILRTQARYLSRGEDPGMTVNSYMFPVVLGYGLRSDLSLFVRQVVVRRERTVQGKSTTDSGIADTYVFAKYKGYRFNSRSLTFGLAPTLGVEFPNGQTGFTSDTWDVKAGVYASARTQTWSSDANVAYRKSDLGDNDHRAVPGDELSLDAAVAYQFMVDKSGSVTASPVLEMSYIKTWPHQEAGEDKPNTGTRVLYLSPGAKLATSSLILEGLVRIPVYDHLVGDQLKSNLQAIFGLRVLF